MNQDYDSMKSEYFTFSMSSEELIAMNKSLLNSKLTETI